MLKYGIVILIALFSFQIAEAQNENPKVYCIDGVGKLVERQFAQNIIAIYPAVDTLGFKLYPIKEYYPDYSLKLKTLSVTDDYANLVFVSSCMTFFQNGNEQSNAIYINGHVRGIIANYYPNGKFYSTEKINRQGIHLLISCNDSTGNALAVNGEGKWLKYNGDRSKMIEAGMVKDSLEEGEWHVSLLSGDYTVVYHRGEIISSTDANAAGKEPVYTTVDTAAKYAKKDGSFLNFLIRNLRYPARARENNIQGKVVVTFIVEKNGTTSSFKTIKSVSDDLDAESIRVLKLMQFAPAIRNGKPVRSYFTIPLVFSLGHE